MWCVLFNLNMIAMATSLPQPASEGKLSSDQVRAVRNAVYDGKPMLAPPDDYSVDRVLILPRALKDVYKEKPSAVLGVLLVIMDGASPKDSVLAAGYAFELVNGPGGGVVCIEVFDRSKYDLIEKNWKATPRQHWIEHLHSAIEAKKKK